MRPLPGMSVVGEYTTRFDADLALARLAEQGLDSAVLGDPSYSVAPHHVVERMFRLVVRDEVADHATAVLSDGVAPDEEAEALDAAFYLHRFADRPTWIRWGTWTVLAAMAGPILLMLLLELWLLSGEIFP